MSVLPSAADGVPTHTSETSASRTASCGSVVVRSDPRVAVSYTNWSSPGSMTGLRPLAIISTFEASTSTPQTSWPREARHAAVTVPTYPRPKTATLTVESPHLRANFPDHWDGHADIPRENRA